MAHTTILRLPTVKARTALSRSSIYKFIGAGKFPKPVRLGPRAVGWVESEVDDWIAARVAESRNSNHRVIPSLQTDRDSGSSS